jgi:hypothetical protein
MPPPVSSKVVYSTGLWRTGNGDNATPSGMAI